MEYLPCLQNVRLPIHGLVLYLTVACLTSHHHRMRMLVYATQAHHPVSIISSDTMTRWSVWVQIVSLYIFRALHEMAHTEDRYTKETLNVRMHSTIHICHERVDNDTYTYLVSTLKLLCNTVFRVFFTGLLGWFSYVLCMSCWFAI